MPYHKPKQVKLTLDIIIHIHQITYRGHIIRNIGIAPDGMLDRAACNRKVHDVHRLIPIHNRINESAGKRVSSSDAVQNIKTKQLAFIRMTVIPHKRFQTVFTAAVRITYMPCNTFQIRIAFDKRLKDLVLLFITRLQRHAVFQIALRVIRLVFP